MFKRFQRVDSSNNTTWIDFLDSSAIPSKTLLVCQGTFAHPCKQNLAFYMWRGVSGNSTAMPDKVHHIATRVFNDSIIQPWPGHGDFWVLLFWILSAYLSSPFPCWTPGGFAKKRKLQRCGHSMFALISVSKNQPASRKLMCHLSFVELEGVPGTTQASNSWNI